MCYKPVGGTGMALLLVVVLTFTSHHSATRVEEPVPGAILLSFDEPVRVDVQSSPISVGDQRISIVDVNQAQFELDEGFHLVATINAAIIQYAKVDYWIYAAIFDERGRLLAADSHREPVEYIRISRIPTLRREMKFDFGISEKFQSATYVVVSIGERKVPVP